jgi:Phosphodiester glycosidase
MAINYYLKKNFWLIIAVFLILFLPFLLYAQMHLKRPPRTNIETTLFQGIVYRREARSLPRPYILHIVTIDLTAPGIGVLVTPGKPTPDDREIHARTTSEFVQEFKVQLAINANFFFPFREENPWDFYPRSGERVNVLGQAISREIIYSPAQAQWPVLCFNDKNRAQIIVSGNCLNRTVQAVAGRHILVENGAAVNPRNFYHDKPYARVAVACDRLGKKLWLIAIDGKQPFYSEGVT